MLHLGSLPLLGKGLLGSVSAAYVDIYKRAFAASNANVKNDTVPITLGEDHYNLSTNNTVLITALFGNSGC